MNSSDMKKIVIVEDSKETSNILREILEREGYQVICALNGVDGYRMIKREKPDLILLDLLLPKVSGFDLCLKINQDLELRKIPIIVISTLADEKETKQKLKNIDIIRFMKKPYNIDELIFEIKNILK